jgi:hypothetical protein
VIIERNQIGRTVLVNPQHIIIIIIIDENDPNQFV